MDQVIHFILMPIFWIPVVGILAFLTYRNYKKLNKLKVLNVDSVLLMLEIPRTNDKKELAAEQMFASLHGILRDKNELKNSGGVQEHLSFEIVSTAGQIRFYVWVPKVLQSFVEGQIYSQYPSVQIYKMNEDYVDDRSKYPVSYMAELGLTENEALPIKTFDTFEVDPLAGITGTLAKLDPDKSEEMWIQILTRPIPDNWHKSTTDKWVSRVKSGRKPLLMGTGIDWTWLVEVLGALFRPPAGGSGADAPKVELSERAKTQITKAEEKATKLGYEVKIRLVYLGADEISARLNMQALVGTFKQFNSTNLNGFKQVGGSFNAKDLDAYKIRQFSDRGFILNISELASVYHLPHTSVETPNIVWASSKTAEPPAKLPVMTGNPAIDAEISAFGLTNFRGINHQFGLTRRDRSRHVYIIGQTGAGKSGMLELLALSDVFYNQGYCIIDPHGDFAIDNLKFVPESRIKDVVYFNPADTAYPVAFNPLEITDPSRKPNICSEVIGVLKRMFGDSWGPRLEHILRYTLLALLDRPETTLLDISRMLTDKDFRKETLDYCTDVTVLQFWKHEFGQWNEKQVNESIAPVLNKVGAFTANPIIRNIIGQPKSSFDIRKIMDEGKILVVNLSKGLIGEDNAGILGAFLVTKVQLAAMSRSDIPLVEDRRPFYLYVDEFQNFATDSFAVILSEARKYGLNLTVANQYVAQMTDSVRDAVFGNVGTTISFRVSADDAPILVKQFEPTFEASDLLQLNNRHFIISMIINGEKVPAFSATTLSIPDTPADNFEAIIAWSRENYARPRAEVEAEIRETIEQSEKYKRELSDSGRTEQKPNFKYVATPQADLRRTGMSPNAAEGKERLGLKDLARLVAEKNEEAGNGEKSVENHEVAERHEAAEKSADNVGSPSGKATENQGGSMGSRDKSSKRRRRRPEKRDSRTTHSSPVKSGNSPVTIEYQEKPVVKIEPTEKRVDLHKPVKNPSDYAEVDNSMDGVLSIKH
ncbi:type IV secretion system DNA-binding domain-containing protein [Candidatus Saccharibacteria bacterium]|nr:type IV secretion system DNA-binding domain-containing protein [Candidatus Saccharibacteria bacterium]MBQ3445821.1 type IV secretion system DNA-binding domain-containing protein [Candidatus Saccharibacteria bacterium]